MISASFDVIMAPSKYEHYASSEYSYRYIEIDNIVISLLMSFDSELDDSKSRADRLGSISMSSIGVALAAGARRVTEGSYSTPRVLINRYRAVSVTYQHSWR